jgi:hypothetical protein
MTMPMHDSEEDDARNRLIPLTVSELRWLKKVCLMKPDENAAISLFPWFFEVETLKNFHGKVRATNALGGKSLV